jgi:predicted nucleic acid-binding protein
MIKTVSPVVVCDAGPVIHLHDLRKLELLDDFSTVLVPSLVWVEVLRHRPKLSETATLRFEIARPRQKIFPELSALAKSLALRRGEWQALQVAQERPGSMLLSDDMGARLAARHLGPAVHGTIGILLRSLRRGQKNKDEILTVRRRAPGHSSLHLKRALLQEIILELEQHDR